MAAPFAEGAVKLMVACTFPAVAVPITGAAGTPAGVTEFDAADAAPVPTLLVAFTVKVYAVPFVSPATIIGEAVPVPVNPPGEDVTVYPVIAAPFAAGAVKAIEAEALPAVAVPMTGASGTAAGVTAFEAADLTPVPTAFDALTVKV